MFLVAQIGSRPEEHKNCPHMHLVIHSLNADGVVTNRNDPVLHYLKLFTSILFLYNIYIYKKISS